MYVLFPRIFVTITVALERTFSVKWDLQTKDTDVSVARDLKEINAIKVINGTLNC